MAFQVRQRPRGLKRSSKSRRDMGCTKAHRHRGGKGVTCREVWRGQSFRWGTTAGRGRGKEQIVLAKATFSCRGDMVRIFSPTEQARFIDHRQKEKLPFYCLLDPPHPVISFLLGIGVDFIHLRTSWWSTDQKHSSLLISNFSSNELLKGNNWWLLILREIGGCAHETSSSLKSEPSWRHEFQKAAGLAGEAFISLWSFKRTAKVGKFSKGKGMEKKDGKRGFRGMVVLKN
jgi:hypothetical protein